MEKESEPNIPPLHIVYGNDLNKLAEKLGEELFTSSSSPFENRLVVVPNISVKEFLFQRFVAHPRLKIAAGVQILPLNQAVMEILDNVSGPSNKKKIPSFLELSLVVEEKLHSPLINNFPDLLEYLDVSDDAEKKRKRIATLSDELARLFARYGLYGQKFLSEWIASDGWQSALWREIFSADSPWTYPIEALKKIKIEKYEGKIALFGFSYLSLAHLLFFCSIPASVYQISPCALFWGDQPSDKEQLYIKRALHRTGTKENIRDEIDRYLQAGHPLLGNWGKLGREMLKSLDSFALLEDETYCEPQGTSLLSNLKRSLLDLDETESLKADDSLQLHSATSKLREVEILRDTLETILQKHSLDGDPIMPREICVASPDISSYAPYIQMVFSQSPLAYAIDGMPLASVSEAVQAFLQLIKLPQERFALDSVLKLFRCTPFMQKIGFALDEVQQLKSWFKQAQIKDALANNPNSWEEGLDRLLYGLALIPDEAAYFETWPVGSIPQSEIDLLNRFLEVFDQIKRDLSLFLGEKSATEWFEIFLQISEKYLSVEWESEPFFQELKALALSCRTLKEQIWNFESITRAIDHLAQKPAGEISSSQMQKILFTSLKLGNIGAARIIFCLGMDEGAFPRADTRSSLCEMTRVKNSDYFPLRTDEDRSLFLELFVRAQDYLIFSYQRIHAEDAKHQGPSLLVEELNQYLHKRGLFDGMTAIHHPAFPFDQVYFSSQSPVKKWSQNDYLAAKAHYFPHQEQAPFFTWPTQGAVDGTQEIVIDIRQLKKLARNPLQFYFNETLKIYLKEEDDEEEAEFLLSHLHKSILRKKALGSNLSQVMRQIKAEGKMPRGLFQDASVQELEEEMSDLVNELKEFGIRKEEISSVRLSASCLAHEKEEGLLPALTIPLSNSKIAHIIGTLEDLSPKGLLYHGDNDLKSLVRAWPLYLIYRCLHLENNKPLLLTKKGAAVEWEIPDPQAALADYLEYYLLAKQTPSPLMPEWAKALLEGGENTFRDVLLKVPNFEDPYLQYLKQRQGLFEPTQIFAFWSERLSKLFAPLFTRR
jgi:exodeoxyribonuclease V gamma subunit